MRHGAKHEEFHHNVYLKRHFFLFTKEKMFSIQQNIFQKINFKMGFYLHINNKFCRIFYNEFLMGIIWMCIIKCPLMRNLSFLKYSRKKFRKGIWIGFISFFLISNLILMCSLFQHCNIFKIQICLNQSQVLFTICRKIVVVHENSLLFL